MHADAALTLPAKGADQNPLNIPDWLLLPEPRSFRPKRRYRTVWISDVHLGTRGSKAEELVAFLRSIEPQTLYLVGDIIDGWSLRKAWYWPDTHNEVVRRILKMAHRGTKVIFVIGNHDEVLRDYAGFTLGGVRLALEAEHETADGRRLLVTHGDSFDGVVLYARWLAFLGDRAYAFLLRANYAVNAVRKRLNLPYWSLSAYMKSRVKNAVQFVSNFENALIHEASTRGFDGIVSGHIHCAEIRQVGDITYYNDGDWVESCTALAEDVSGTISILNWNMGAPAETQAEAQAECEA